MGSFCRGATSSTAEATYGDNICASLNCIDNDGKERLHGESWCSYDGFSAIGLGQNAVGSRHFRQVCNNGLVTTESCADFRQEECIEDAIDTSQGDFSQAACRVNRWQDCTAQTNRRDCSNFDRRDCAWFEGVEYILMGGVTEGGTIEGASVQGIREKIEDEVKSGERDLGACVPANPPGLNFWQISTNEDGEEVAGEAAGICAQANAVCDVTFEKGLIGGDWEPVKNEECLPGGPLEAKRAQLCVSMGDCGPNVNWVGRRGYNKGYAVTVTDTENKDKGGGLF